MEAGQPVLRVRSHLDQGERDMLQSIELEVRGLQQASKRLELATDEWEEALRSYAAALAELNRKTLPSNGHAGQAAGKHLKATHMKV